MANVFKVFAPVCPNFEHSAKVFFYSVVLLHGTVHESLRKPGSVTIGTGLILLVVPIGNKVSWGKINPINWQRFLLLHGALSPFISGKTINPSFQECHMGWFQTELVHEFQRQ